MSRFPSITPAQALIVFTINVGKSGMPPRRSFPCMAFSRFAAVRQHECLAQRGELVEAIPLFAEVQVEHLVEEARDLRIPFTADCIDVPDLDALRQVGAI